MSVLRISRATYQAIQSHGEEAYPHECCGVLIGGRTPQGPRVNCAKPARNVRTDSPHNRYEIDPAELVSLLREAGRQGLDILGFYHSHPDHPAQWSNTDLAEAHWLGCSYIITEVVQGKALVMNSFLLAGTTEEDKRFELETILIE